MGVSGGHHTCQPATVTQQDPAPEACSNLHALRGGVLALSHRLRVHVGAHHLDAYEALVTIDPGVVSRRDRVRVAGPDCFLGPVVEPDGDLPRNGIPDV